MSIYNSLFRELAAELGNEGKHLLRGQGGLASFDDFGVDHGFHTDLKIGSGELEFSVGRFKKNIGKHGKGIARIDDIADPLQGFQHGFSGNLDFHGGFASDLPAVVFLPPGMSY